MTAQRILIVGGTGSLGRALLGRLVADNEIMLYSRDEAKHWSIRNQIGPRPNVSYTIGDVRDPARIEDALLNFRPTLILDAAALKQIDTCELAPNESVQTNILGVRNVIDAVRRQSDRLPDLEAVLLISTDKACAPTNVYGMCKAIAERLITSQVLTFERPRFVAVRYGNVLQSRGSIVPLLRWQAAKADSFTITHPDMTRFIMTLDESIDLIIAAWAGASSGEMWLPKLRSMRIADLVGLFSERYGKPVRTIGVRPGEKLHEVLISEAESVRTAFDGRYFRMKPAHQAAASGAKVFAHTSEDDLFSPAELSKYLQSKGVFQDDVEKFARDIDDIGDPVDQIIKQ